MAFDKKRDFTSIPYGVRVEKRNNGSAFFKVTQKKEDGTYEDISDSQNLSGEIVNFSFTKRTSNSDGKEIAFVNFCLLDRKEKQIYFVEMFESMLSDELLNKLHGNDLNVPTNFWLANAQTQDENGKWVDVKTAKGKLVPRFNIRPVGSEEKFYVSTLWDDTKSETAKCTHPLVADFKAKKEITIEAKVNTIMAKFIREKLFIPYLLENGWEEKESTYTNEKGSTVSKTFKNKNLVQDEPQEDNGEQNNVPPVATGAGTTVGNPSVNTNDGTPEDLPF